MRYDKESNRWFLNEFHLKHYKDCWESNARLQNFLPLSAKRVAANQERWNAMGEK